MVGIAYMILVIITNQFRIIAMLEEDPTAKTINWTISFILSLFVIGIPIYGYFN